MRRCYTRARRTGPGSRPAVVLRSARLRLRCDHLVRALLPEHGGREVDRTDAFLLTFAPVDEAVAWARALHDALGALSRRRAVRVRARVAVHTGPAVLIENSPDAVARGARPIELEGLSKPLVARIASVVPPGRALLSGSAREELSQDEGLIHHGSWTLEGIGAPVELSPEACWYPLASLGYERALGLARDEGAR